jgi:hypothetical protein
MKVIAIEKMYCIILDRKTTSECLGEINESVTIVKIYDDEARKTHYAQWPGVRNAIDFLPGGSLYLADTFDEAVKILNERK